MQQFCLACVSCTVLLALSGLVEAQSVAPTPLPNASLAAPEFPGTAPPSPPLATPCDPSCLVNLEIGFPTGVRFQHALGEDAGRNWLIEGFAGVDVIFPMAGGGIRRRFTPVCGTHNALVLSPGVDAYILYNPLHDLGGWLSGRRSAFGLVSLDVDIFWDHTLGEHCSSQFGVKLGAGDAFGAGQALVPIVSLVFGLRF